MKFPCTIYRYDKNKQVTPTDVKSMYVKDETDLVSFDATGWYVDFNGTPLSDDNGVKKKNDHKKTAIE